MYVHLHVTDVPLSSLYMPTNVRHADTKRTQEREGLQRGYGNVVAIIGLGYVGLPLALLAQERGYDVRGYDIDKKKVDKLKRRVAEFLPEEESKMLQESDLSVSTDESILDGVDIYVVCVPTPVHGNRLPDLRPLKSACQAIGRHMKKDTLVIIESTISPGVCENVALPELEKASGLKGGTDFSFAHCPERINPGDNEWNVRTIPRVIGGLDPKSLARSVRFYESITDAPLRAMESIKEAEAVKMVENAFRDINIAFVNELAMSFGSAGIDITNVIEGAATKPFGFVPHSPGCGVGGHCIPVDPYYLIRYGRENGFEHRFLVTARKINSGMPRYTVKLLDEALKERSKSFSEVTIALLGLSYKRDVPDTRESPALVIRRELLRNKANVRVFDPFVPMQNSAASLAEALEGADAAVIATDHTAFQELMPEDFKKHGVEIVIDGRNCLPKHAFLAQGLTYRGIGR